MKLLAIEHSARDGFSVVGGLLVFCAFFFFFSKTGSETKKRTKEEEIDKGDYGPPRRNEGGPVVYPVSAFDFRLPGD